MNNQGWIKTHRTLQEKGWYCKSQYVHLWIHLILKANHKNKEFWFNGQNILVKRGQVVTGRKQLSLETGISESQIQRILKCFESEQQIEQQTNNRNRLITILNYDTYQKIEQPMHNNGTTSEQQQDTNKNEDNNKNDKSIVAPTTFSEYWEIWKQYKSEQHKFKYKSPLSEQSALKKLMNLSDGNEETAILIIEQSMANGWSGLFKIKQDDTKEDKLQRQADFLNKYDEQAIN